MTSSILFENDEKTVVLLDLPRSIEEAQLLPLPRDPSQARASHLGLTPPPPADGPGPSNNDTTGSRRKRLVSSRPPDVPYAIPEPKRAPPSPASPSAQVAELMTLAAVQAALAELQETYSGPWLLPRVFPSAPPPPHIEGSDRGGALSEQLAGVTKRKAVSPAADDEGDAAECDAGEDNAGGEPGSHHLITIPPESRYVQGTIESTRHLLFAAKPGGGGASPPPPQFDLIVLDPPWPNRSARRKKRGGRRGEDHYHTAYGTAEIRRLLSLIPVSSCLAPDGLVAVWVTNRAAFAELLTCPGRGVFAADWGVELVAQWTWLKVTTEGKPIFPLGYTANRRPWERLLIARRRRRKVNEGAPSCAHPPPPPPVAWERKVLVSVPDVHSRKPNLRGLFGQILPPGFLGLEVFARNLTAGWWSWGDDVLRFQGRSHWVEDGANLTAGNRAMEEYGLSSSSLVSEE